MLCSPARTRFLAAFLVSLLVAAFWPFVPRSVAQDQSGASDEPEETVANLAAGRVVIVVVKGAIIVGTVENPIEAESLAPTPVALTSIRLGVILGAARWSSPSSRQDLARFDQELPQMRGRLIAAGPHLQDSEAGAEATDIENIGQGFLERLNDVAQGLHARVDLPPNEPLAELVLVDYLPSYGPEVWQLSYGIKQQEEKADYWTTRVLRPAYLQFWPPEKGQPRTPVEFNYPPENSPPTLLDLLRQKDPRLEKLIASDAKMAFVAGRILQGETSKVLPDDATQFLRAALDAISPPSARQTMAIISQEKGFEWILPPPPEPAAPPLKNPQRPPNAPTLMHPPQ